MIRVFPRCLVPVLALLCAFTAYAQTPPAYLLELEDAPAAAVYAAQAAAGKSASVAAYVDSLETAQRAVLSELTAKESDTRVLFCVQRVLNGIAVTSATRRAEDLAAIPGVKAVHTLSPVRLCNATSMPFLDLPAIWDGLGFGLTGEGISIGIVDTGIDYLHPDFGGTGSASDHANNDTTTISDGYFPTAKVVGGYDFVGDAYDPDNPAHVTPILDADPMDQRGHGTHVAGIAAGFGVTSTGTAYAGPYGTDTDFSSLLVGPGAAPRADLYALKVFGATGITYVVIPAIEWATDPNNDGDLSDHLDVINLSLGEDFFSSDAPTSVACDNAALAGIVVVVAAGNAGDIFFSLASPGSAARVITVAASEDDDPAEAVSADRLASFSSRGPAQGDNGYILKPDLAAPGKYIVSAALFNSSQPSILARKNSGTSMATPHVAGMMALLRQLLPGWTPAELKALAMNTAINDVYRLANQGLPRVAPVRTGAGRIDPGNAATSRVIAYDADHPERVSITFDTRDVVTSVVERRMLRIENKGDAPVSFTAAFDVVTAMPGIDMFIDPEQTGPIAPGAYTDIEIGFQADASRMKHPLDPAASGGLNEHVPNWFSEFSGYVALTPVEGTAVPLRVPFHGSMRRASNMTTAETGLSFTEKAESQITLRGQGVMTGEDFPFDLVSLVTPFALLDYDPDEAATTGLNNGADIKFVGVTTDYATTQSVPDSTVCFGIATWGEWLTPNWVRFEISVDIDEDGTADALVYSCSYPLDDNAPLDSDIFASRVSDLGPADKFAGYVNGFSAGVYDTAPYFTNVMYLPVKAADLGLTSLNSGFAFRVRAFVRDETLGYLDETDPMHYSITAPGLTFSAGENGLPTHYDHNNHVIGVTYDATAYAANGALGALLLHHHNPSGERAVWLPLITTGDSDGDNIPDSVEGGSDYDNDGIPSLLDTDSDDDGIPDLIEGTENPDGDALPNYIDTDSDDDTLSDEVEWQQPRTDPYNADTDGDGIDDGVEGRIDSDDDGTINALDTDSDDDGIPDILEGVADPDEDLLANFLDPDSDDDGIPDLEEGALDTDGDTTPNYLDLDSDDDSLSDEEEYGTLGTSPYLKDTDDDGRTDDAEVEAGTDPKVPQAPPAATNVTASDGAYADHVEIAWDDVPGLTEYRVYRNTTNDVATATAITEWTTALHHDDSTAAAAVTESGACRKPTTTYTKYFYWVLTRNAGGEGPYSTADEGYRGAAKGLFAALPLAGVMALLLVWRRKPKQKD